MSIQKRTLRIAQVVQRTIYRQTKIHTMKYFELNVSESREVAFYLYLSNSHNVSCRHDRAYGLLDTHYITQDERRAVVPIVTDGLHANGFTYYLNDRVYIPTEPIRIEPLASLPDVSRDIVDHDSFFRALHLDSCQIARVKGKLPDGAPIDDFLLLAGFDDNLLRACFFTDVQIRAWKRFLGGGGLRPPNPPFMG